ncbi:YdcF family protein [Xanthobacter sp. V4C-4]|uniref:YdcF family protein n=1 Tax=Xanthobacter cornucopiae TaxID=3119924 RepID=UPI00372B48C9
MRTTIDVSPVLPRSAARPSGRERQAEAAGRADGAGAPQPVAAPKPPGRRRLWLRLAKGVVLLAGAGGLAVLAGFLAFLTQIAAREPVQVRSADAIVVLTGGASRIADAVSLLSEGRGRRLLITGVNPITSPGELGRMLPSGEALISCCVDLGHKALNTRGNAIEAAEWTRSQNFRSLVVVTSAWHMPRALVELNRSLPDVELVAYPVVTSRMEAERWWRDPATVRLLFKEYLKYMMAKAQIRPVQAVAEAPRPLAPAEARAAP